jgi:hypothetical protein
LQQLDDVKDLTMTNLVNREWRTLSDDELVWQALCQKDFSLHGLDSSFLTSAIFKKTEIFKETWKKTYQFYGKKSAMGKEDLLILMEQDTKEHHSGTAN